MSENDMRECPWCHGYGEIMTRDKAIDSDGSEDIGNTPYPTACLGCKGEGVIKKLRLVQTNPPKYKLR